MKDLMVNSERMISYESILSGIDRIAEQISEDLSHLEPVILCVMNGGVVFYGHLLPKLLFPLQHDYLHVGRYGNETQGQDIAWKKEPDLTLSNRHVLIVDDILDEGKTLAHLIDYCQGENAASVRTAVLLNKIHNRKYRTHLKADYCIFDIPDKFVFGFGLDYKGFWRNAPGIFAVQADKEG